MTAQPLHLQMNHSHSSPSNNNSYYSFLHKLPLKLIFSWSIIFLFVYFLIIKHPRLGDQILQKSPKTLNLVDGIVYIAMGSMAESDVLDYSIESLVSLGKWNGRIYIITDKSACFDSLVSHNKNLHIINIPPANSIIEIKALKTRIFDLIPKSSELEKVLYLDADIVVKRDLEPFFFDLSGLLSDNSQNKFDIALFQDAKGHFVGFCSGCDKWHTGILFLQRNQGNECLEQWRINLISERFTSDQESFDEAENQGYCSHVYSLPRKHLLFAKDYIAMLFTSGHSFLHLTSISRIDEQDYFYRSVIVPRLRNGLHLHIDSSEPKHCDEENSSENIESSK